MPTEDFFGNLGKDLSNPEIASGFLNEAFETGTDQEIANSVRLVLEANGWQKGEPVTVERGLVYLREHGIGVASYRAAA